MVYDGNSLGRVRIVVILKGGGGEVVVGGWVVARLVAYGIFRIVVGVCGCWDGGTK